MRSSFAYSYESRVYYSRKKPVCQEEIEKFMYFLILYINYNREMAALYLTFGNVSAKI